MTVGIRLRNEHALGLKAADLIDDLQPLALERAEFRVVGLRETLLLEDVAFQQLTLALQRRQTRLIIPHRLLHTYRRPQASKKGRRITTDPETQ